jgi:hypothetical protein
MPHYDSFALVCWSIADLSRDTRHRGRIGMTKREFAAVLVGIILGVSLILVVGGIYVSNLHHVACKMYNAVDDRFRFDYVNKQFRCTKDTQ